MDSTHSSSALVPFEIHIPESKLAEMRDMIKIAKLSAATFESQDKRFGVTSEWMARAKSQWETFDWRVHEKELNQIPQFLAMLEDKDAKSFQIHFVGIFAESPDAETILLLHGWPGSFLEFMPTIQALKKSVSPKFNIIAPSLPGYLFSSGPPLDRNFGLHDVAFLLNRLMAELGFSAPNGGYLAQGGDIGGLVPRTLALSFDLSIYFWSWES